MKDIRNQNINAVVLIGLVLFLLNSCNYDNQKQLHLYHSEYGNFDFISYSKPKYEKHRIKDLTMHAYSYTNRGFSYSASFYEFDSVFTSDELLLNNLVGGIIGK